MRNLILGGLLLPLKLYFQPNRFRAEIAALAPDLPENYNLSQALEKWRDTKFLRALGRLRVQALVSQVWSVLMCLVLQSIGFEINWSNMTVGVILGVGMGVGLEVARSDSESMAAGLAKSIVSGIALSIVLGVAEGALWGLAPIIVRGFSWFSSWSVGGSLCNSWCGSRR